MGKFYHMKGKGLISPNNSLDERFKRMTLMGTGTQAHKHIEGGTIKYHNHPYQLKIVQKHHQDQQDILPKSISNYKTMFDNNRMIDIGDYIDDALTYDDDIDWF
jgi:hypothetical protein